MQSSDSVSVDIPTLDGHRMQCRGGASVSSNEVCLQPWRRRSAADAYAVSGLLNHAVVSIQAEQAAAAREKQLRDYADALEDDDL